MITGVSETLLKKGFFNTQNANWHLVRDRNRREGVTPKLDEWCDKKRGIENDNTWWLECDEHESIRKTVYSYLTNHLLIFLHSCMVIFPTIGQ